MFKDISLLVHEPLLLSFCLDTHHYSCCPTELKVLFDNRVQKQGVGLEGDWEAPSSSLSDC